MPGVGGGGEVYLSHMLSYTHFGDFIPALFLFLLKAFVDFFFFFFFFFFFLGRPRGIRGFPG